MATIALVPLKLFRGAVQWTWETLTETNADGAPVGDEQGSLAFSDKTVHVRGNFGAGGSVSIQGSNIGGPTAADWEILTDPAGAALTFTADGLKTILENPRYIRPFVTAGTGVDLDVIMVGRAILQMR